MTGLVSGGCALAFDDVGPRDAGAVVLLHGYASNRAEMWRRLGWYAAFERRGVRAVAPDLRGHGESGKPHDAVAYAREVLVADVFALMDAVGLERATLFGFSFGARIALSAALAKPERVKNLILGGVGARLLEAPRGGAAMAEAMETDDPETIGEPLLKSFRHFADEQGEDRKALAAFVRGGGGTIVREGLATLSMPVLVLAGQRDALAGDPQALAREFADGRAVTIPGCDHFSSISHALFKASVFDFLDGTMA
jgi:pimeloyl-ACP methyl ester carboxylesterase